MNELYVMILMQVVKLVIEMAQNWNNPEYKPPTPMELEALAKQIAELEDLLVREDAICR